MQGTIFSTHLAFRAAEAVINYTILCIMTLCFELCLFPIATAATGNHDVVQEETQSKKPNRHAQLVPERLKLSHKSQFVWPLEQAPTQIVILCYSCKN